MDNKSQLLRKMYFLKQNYNEERRKEEYTIDIRSLYEKSPFNNGRATQWFKRSFEKINKVKEKYPTEYTELHTINENGLKRGTLVSIKSALLLLIYGENNHLTTDLVKDIEVITDQSIPIPQKQSRYEHNFALELSELLKKLNADTTKEYQLIKHQQRFNKFYVDFYVKELMSDKEYIIEFDESFHQKPQNLKADKARDKDIKRNNPDITLIRVRHEETSLWINSVIDMNELHSMEFMFANFLLKTSHNENKHKIIISAQSAREAFDTPSLQLKTLIPRSYSQPLSYLSKILDRLSVSYEQKQVKRARVLIFNKVKLTNYLIYK